MCTTYPYPPFTKVINVTCTEALDINVCDCNAGFARVVFLPLAA